MAGSGYVETGTLDERISVLKLVQSGTTYQWSVLRRSWARSELSTRKNVYSVHGIGATGVTFTVRRQNLKLDHAIGWRGHHCMITAIRPKGRMHLIVEAALVEVSDCEYVYTETKFPAIMTEKYLGHQQLEPYAVNVLQHVLVTPKAIELEPGRVVEVAGVKWPIQTAHLLDPWKNEYELAREVDL